MKQRITIAIDGPSGVGKSTVAKLIAEERDLLYIDTGAMYRALAVFFIEKGIRVSESESVIPLLKDITLTCDVKREGNVRQQHIYINGEDVTEKLRTEEVSKAASVVSAIPEVREKLKGLQRELALGCDSCMDGRDIGTVILPDALLKIFLTASAHVRAVRRFEQLKEYGQADGLALEVIEKDLTERDYRDSHRKTAPLRPAEDAVIIDSSYMNIDEVKNAVLRELDLRLSAENDGSIK